MALRRPAAAGPAGRRAPRVGAALRRPASRGAGEQSQKGEAEEKFVNGEEVEANLAPLGRLVQGTPVVVVGEYRQEGCRLCGTVQGLQVRHVGDVELQLTGEGTESESLLKWITGHPTVPVRVHLCGSTCPNKVDAEGLVHATKIRQKQRSDEGGWSENLREGRDENAELRREAMALQEKEAKEKERADQKRDDKKTKKKKKEKKKRSSSTGGSSRKKVRSSRKRVNSRKELKDVFGSTGLDPNYKVRRKLVKALKKKLKRKKEESTSGDSSSIDGERGEQRPGQLRGRGDLRGHPQSAGGGPPSSRSSSGEHYQGDAESTPDGSRHSLGPGERGGACGGAAILPQPSGPPPFRGGQPRSSDLVLELRPGASGESCQHGRLLGAEAEEFAADSQWRELASQSKGRSGPARTGTTDKPRRNTGRGQGGQGGAEDESVSKRKRKGKEREFRGRGPVAIRAKGRDKRARQRERQEERKRGRKEELLDLGAEAEDEYEGPLLGLGGEPQRSYEEVRGAPCGLSLNQGKTAHGRDTVLGQDRARCSTGVREDRPPDSPECGPWVRGHGSVWKPPIGLMGMAPERGQMAQAFFHSFMFHLVAKLRTASSLVVPRRHPTDA